MKTEISFSRYGSNQLITITTLQQILKDEPGSLIARAEYSGSEGCYTEVCRWNPRSCRWERFCFRKNFGGELGDDRNAEQTALAIAEMVSLISSDHQIIHKMPTWMPLNEKEYTSLLVPIFDLIQSDDQLYKATHEFIMVYAHTLDETGCEDLQTALWYAIQSFGEIFSPSFDDLIDGDDLNNALQDIGSGIKHPRSWEVSALLATLAARYWISDRVDTLKHNK